MTKYLKRIYKYIVVIAISISALLIQSCGIYSFTGASISPDVKTVEISDFPNYALLVNPALSQTFTQGSRSTPSQAQGQERGLVPIPQSAV